MIEKLMDEYWQQNKIMLLAALKPKKIVVEIEETEEDDLRSVDTF